MTGAGQPRPVIPLIATHSAVAFLAGISPVASHTVFGSVPEMIMGHIACPSHTHTHTHTHTHRDKELSHKHTRIADRHYVSPPHTHTQTQC